MEKEFLYVGHYTDIEGFCIVKIGTTNDLERRRKEHTRNYKKSPHCTMPQDAQFEYDWSLPLSKYNTLRYEDRNKARWREDALGEYIRNDRFKCSSKPDYVDIQIRKTYRVYLN